MTYERCEVQSVEKTADMSSKMNITSKFKCLICESTFGYNNTLRRHLRHVHKLEENEITPSVYEEVKTESTSFSEPLHGNSNSSYFKCLICESSIKGRGNIFNHLRLGSKCIIYDKKVEMSYRL